MGDRWNSKWCWRIGAVVLVGGFVLGASSMVTQAGERDDDRHRGNPFDRILHKLDKILDAIKSGGGQVGNHTLRWDQVLPGAQRFMILTAFNNEAVLDQETGLIWERSPGQGPPWSDVRRICAEKTVGGRKGWRLPALAELTSLLDPTSPNLPLLTPGHPFTGDSVRAVFFWSASTDADRPSYAWTVGFFGGAVESIPKFTGGHNFWCVRGGMQESVY